MIRAAFIVAFCLGFPSPALFSQQQEPAPATSPAKQAAPDNQPSPQAEKTPPAAAKPDANDETKAEPAAIPKAEPPAEPDNQPSDHPDNQPKTESKKKEDGRPPRNDGKGHVSGKRAPPSPAPAPESVPRKIVVREGGAEEPVARIVSGMTPEKASRERQNTEDLLDSTRELLERISRRTLDAHQLETVSQIQNYMEGSRSALKEGDIARADTLAFKAHLLADDLAKH